MHGRIRPAAVLATALLTATLFAQTIAGPAAADANETAVGAGGALIQVSITAGANHTCALLAGGGVKCWGYNSNGQLGDSTNSNSTVPVDVQGLASGASAISAGSLHTCALLSTGAVKCWGRNVYGQLGDGSTTDSNTPVGVSGLTGGVVAITTGFYHSCALLASGAVKCWGYNSDGQLGDSSWTDSSVPVDVATLSSGVTAVSASSTHTCALLSGGGIKCWGLNDYGELGDNSGSAQPSPVDVTGLGGTATAVSTGGYHTCALLSTGAVKCWGLNNLGQIGDGTNTSQPLPTAVSGLTSGVSAITTGNFHSCALLSGGGTKCWGSNADGQLGDGSNTNSNIPIDVSGLTSGVRAVTNGHFYSCVIVTGGGVKCWGLNFRGQLGDGTNIDKTVAASVSGLSSGVGLTTTTTTTTTTLAATTTTQAPSVVVQSATTTTSGTPTTKSRPAGAASLPHAGYASAATTMVAVLLVAAGWVTLMRRRRRPDRVR